MGDTLEDRKGPDSTVNPAYQLQLVSLGYMHMS